VLLASYRQTQALSRIQQTDQADVEVGFPTESKAVPAFADARFGSVIQNGQSFIAETLRRGVGSAPPDVRDVRRGLVMQTKFTGLSLVFRALTGAATFNG